jgi:nitroreductase
MGDHELETLLTRRSESRLAEPGPSMGEVAQILRAATTVPDHGRLRPWRLVVVAGDSRGAFGDALVAVAQAADPELGKRKADKMKAKVFDAPMLIALAACVRTDTSIPKWEQVASAACMGYVITLAAHELGYGAIWKTSPFLDGAAMRTLLDLKKRDVPLGWINLGRHVKASPPRQDADLTNIVRVLDTDGTPNPYRTQ